MATPRPSRARFSCPELADDHVDEAVLAFVHGNESGRGRRPPANGARASANPYAALETRVVWMEALRREQARSIRYRRPASVIVLVVEAIPEAADAGGSIARFAPAIGHTILRAVRETDLVTRASDARFHILLPETTGAKARHVVERVIADCDVWLRAAEARIHIRASVGTTSHEVTLEAALEAALDATLRGTPAT